jgi:hypothetical protein
LEEQGVDWRLILETRIEIIIIIVIMEGMDWSHLPENTLIGHLLR